MKPNKDVWSFRWRCSTDCKGWVLLRSPQTRLETARLPGNNVRLLLPQTQLEPVPRIFSDVMLKSSFNNLVPCQKYPVVSHLGMPTKQTRSAVACLAVSLPVTPLLPPPPPHMPITCTQGYICGLQNHYLLIYPEERVVNSWPFSLIDLNGIAICFHLFKYDNQINLPCLIYQLKIRPPWQFRSACFVSFVVQGRKSSKNPIPKEKERCFERGDWTKLPFLLKSPHIVMATEKTNLNIRNPSRLKSIRNIPKRIKTKESKDKQEAV